MSREEYLNQLHKYLRKLPRQDYEDAMEYFTEYFQETDEEGAEELMKELGTPKEAARELMANLLNKKIEAHQNYETDGQSRTERFRKTCGMDSAIGIICSTGRSSASGSVCCSRSCISCVCICNFVMCSFIYGMSGAYWRENPYPRYTGSSVFYERFCNAYRKWAVGCGRWHPWCTVVRISM